MQPRNAFSLSSPLHCAFCIANTNILNVFHSQLLGNEANDQRSMVNGKLAGTGLGSESFIIQFSTKLATANKINRIRRSQAQFHSSSCFFPI